MFRNTEKKLLRRALTLYAGERVLAGVIKEGEAFLSPHASIVELTMLFLDIAALTNADDGLYPNALGEFTTRYSEAITQTIAGSGGTFDTFVGDSASAWWGVDGERDHAEKAVTCARALLAAIEGLNQQSRLSGHPTIRLKIGVHTGQVTLGNFGSSSRLRYTVMGAAVNLASRLCGLAPQYSVPIVISDATRSRIGSEFSLKRLDTVRVKGKDEPVELFGVAF